MELQRCRAYNGSVARFWSIAISNKGISNKTILTERKRGKNEEEERGIDPASRVRRKSDFVGRTDNLLNATWNAVFCNTMLPRPALLRIRTDAKIVDDCVATGVHRCTRYPRQHPNARERAITAECGRRKIARKIERRRSGVSERGKFGKSAAVSVSTKAGYLRTARSKRNRGDGKRAGR
jgi:hypothetical protein